MYMINQTTYAWNFIASEPSHVIFPPETNFKFTIGVRNQSFQIQKEWRISMSLLNLWGTLLMKHSHFYDSNVFMSEFKMQYTKMAPQALKSK